MKRWIKDTVCGVAALSASLMLLSGSTVFAKSVPVNADLTQAQVVRLKGDSIPAGEKKKLEAFTKDVRATIKDSFDDAKVTRKGRTITASFYIDGVAELAEAAADGEDEVIDEWDDMVSSLEESGADIYKQRTNYGVKKAHFTLILKNDEKKSKNLVVIKDGETTYDRAYD
ncbi:MAG: hypothetical protein IJ679_12855 [Lachnospiraceae bacterium]|nr:hypothetical protein [Lachnospiraceae bacterium]